MARAEAAALALLCITGSGAAAGGLDLTPAERVAFGAEVRALLLAEPEIVGRVLAPAQADPFEGFSDEAAADTALLAELAGALVDDPADWAEGPSDGTPLVAFLSPRPVPTAAHFCPTCGRSRLGRARGWS